ncbi:MAG TPA: acyl-CoA dehydrogenase family protein [Acetobacteraceae bacterium]|nr:acyl-CoA dehydrogenase family protein [Acetobacteraceae bacterium]
MDIPASSAEAAEGLNFRLTSDQKRLIETVRRVTQERFKPAALRYLDGSFPWDNLKLLAELGVAGMTVPEAYGGLGMGTLESALVLEEIAKGCYATAMMMLGEIGVQCRIISYFAPESLRQRFLPRIVAGECVLAICITEPDAGTDAARMRTNADVRGERVVLNGAKTLISRADVADLFIVFTRVDRKPGGEGIGCLLFEKGAKGLIAEAKYHTMGGEMLSEVRFEDVEVPAENLIVRENGIRRLFNAFNVQRCLNSAICLGSAEGAFDECVRYMQLRQVSGHAIAEFQGLRWKLVDMYKEIEAGRSLLYRACVSGGEFPDPMQAALAKIYCNEMAITVTSHAVQMHGGYGYTDEYPVSRLFRAARFGGLGGGTPDMLRNLVARRLFDRIDASEGILSLDTF